MRPLGRLLSIQLAVQARDRIRACTQCSLHKTATAPVPWSGATPATYAMVGQAPGYHEDRSGKPFNGPAGAYLKTALAKANFPMRDVAYLNPCNCYPGRALSGDIKPVRGQLEACNGHLIGQLHVIQPQYIFLLGATALEAFRPDLTLTTTHGRPLFFQAPYPHARPTYMWVTYHPSAAMRGGKYAIEFTNDLDLFWEWRRGDEEFPQDCFKCHKAFHAWDEWGVAACELHSAKQLSLL